MATRGVNRGGGTERSQSPQPIETLKIDYGELLIYIYIYTGIMMMRMCVY